MPRDILAPYLFILCLDYILWTSVDQIKENGFTLKKAKSWQYPTETVSDADYSENLALLTNAPAEAESLVHSLEQVVENISFYVNTNKTEFTCFKPKGVISTLNNKPLKLVDQFTYLSSSISPRKNDVKAQWKSGMLLTGYQSHGWSHRNLIYFIKGNGIYSKL